MVYPGALQAYVIVNSGTTVNLSDLLKEAFDDALVNVDS
jgi:hypothetical protein